MRKNTLHLTPYTLLTMSFIVLSLVGIMAFLPSPTVAEIPLVSTIEEDTAFIPTPQRANNEAIWEIASHVDATLYDNNHVFFKFKEGFDFDEEGFFKEHSLVFGLRDDDEMRLVKQNKRVLKYQQFYKGIKVQEGGYSINKNSSGKILRAAGTIIENININIGKKILESDALKIVLDSIGSEKYIWDNPKLCKKLEEVGQSCYPKADLLITVGQTESFIASSVTLNYVFKIYIDENLPSYTGIINASTGIITSLFQNINHSCTTGKVSTYHHGSQSFEVEQIGSEYAIMSTCIDGIPFGGWVVAKDKNKWSGACSSHTSCLVKQNTPNGWTGQKEASALYAIEEAYKYFKNNFNDFGYDELKVIINSSIVTGMAQDILIPNKKRGILYLQPNGSYNYADFLYNYQNVNDLETIGHEIFHAIDQKNEEVWQSYDETGEITESVCDIFGAILTMKTLNINLDSYDWIFGNYSTTTNKAMRSFKEPNNYGYHFPNPSGSVSTNIGHPDYFQQSSFWHIDPPNANVLDHYINTGVINHWFYLLANGGSNKINGGITKTVKSGIDIDDIAKILYYLYTDGDLVANVDDYETFAQKTINKASDLLNDGELSTNDKSIICRIIEAFNAVNLQPYYPEGECVLNVQEKNFKKVSDENSCDCEVALEICGANSYDIEWFKIDNGVETAINPSNPEHVTNLCNYEYRYKVTDKDNHKCIIDETINCKNTTTGQTIDAPRHAPNNSNTNLAVTGVVNNCGAIWAGDIDITVTGGTGTYTYLWSNGATTEDLTGVVPGSYTVTVTGSGIIGGVGTTVGGPFIVSPLNVQTLHQSNACGDDGYARINLGVSGGTPPYTYLWSHGAPVKDITILGSTLPANGNPTGYNVIVTDAKGCTETRYYYLKKYEPVINGSTTKACDYWQDGTVSVTASQGYPPYTFSWTSTTGFTAGNNTSLSGLAAGWYHATVTDVKGCSSTESFQVGVEPAIDVPYWNNPNQCLTIKECHGQTYGPTTDVSFPSINFNPSFSNPQASTCELRSLCPHDPNFNQFITNGTIIEELAAIPNPNLPPGQIADEVSEYVCVNTFRCTAGGLISQPEQITLGIPVLDQQNCVTYQGGQTCCNFVCNGVTTSQVFCWTPPVPPEGNNDGVLNVYPAPFNNTFNIEFKTERTSATIRLSDGLGRLIKEEIIETFIGDNNYKMDVTGLVTNGFYYVTVEIPNQPILVQKIIRQK